MSCHQGDSERERHVPFAQVWLLEVLNYLRVLDNTTKGIVPEDKRLEWFVSPSFIVSSTSCIVCDLGFQAHAQNGSLLPNVLGRGLLRGSVY